TSSWVTSPRSQAAWCEGSVSSSSTRSRGRSMTSTTVNSMAPFSLPSARDARPSRLLETRPSPHVPERDGAERASWPERPDPRRTPAMNAPEPESGTVLGEDGLARPAWAARDPLLREYYDTEWGMPVRDEQGMYERLSLEAFQA